MEGSQFAHEADLSGRVGLEPSPLAASVIPSSQILHASLSWREMVLITDFLSTQDLYRGIGKLNRAGFVFFQHEQNCRRRDKSKDCARFAKPLDWIAREKKGKYKEKVVLTSYPRSGNSHLRNLLEQATGLITGSDNRPNRNLSASLIRFGFRGEGVLDASCRIVKSHFPERTGYRAVAAEKVVLLVRNPFDAILSYFHMGFTNTHHKSLHPSVLDSPPLSDIWLDFNLEEAKVWVRFHEYWLDVLQKERVPVMLVRYEDLMHSEQKEGIMTELLRFIEATSRCTEVGSKQSDGREKGPGYSKSAYSQSRSQSPAGGSAAARMGKSLSRIPLNLMPPLLKVLSPMLETLGYHVAIQEEAASLSLSPLPDVCAHPNAAAAVFFSRTYVEHSKEASECRTVVMVNGESEKRAVLYTRPSTDKYGRAVTALRRSLTGADTRPFATM